jgi:outer membrane biosynthesis protein TonB
VTNISYDLNADSMELLFTPLRGISDEEYALVVAAQADPETKKYVQLTVSAADAAAKPAAKVEPKPEPKPAVTRSEEPDDEDEAPAEPVKRSAKPTAVEEAPAATGDLASIVSAWGDDAEDED